MKRALLFTTALIAPSTAWGQVVQDGFVRPPDVPPYVEKFNGYAAGTAENTIGDGSTDRGGVMPVIATMPADIPSTAPGWVTARGGTADYEEVTNPAAQEVKFRTSADMSHCNFDDPIRNWGQPGTSHAHCFFGSTSGNAFSTYASLRTRANALSAQSKAASTAAGGPYWATEYWHPAVIKPNAFGDGKNYIVKVSDYIIYYVFNPATPALYASRIARGDRYVFGVRMDDPYDTIVKAEIAAANAQPGTAGRYAYNGNGFLGWHCYANANKTGLVPITVPEHPTTLATGQNYYQGFKTAGGADPWGGNCPAGGWLVANFQAPSCYDGTNIWSPGGYRNRRQRLIDTVSSRPDDGCPKNWYLQSGLSITMWLKHQGFADYSTWYLSSDASATAKAQQIDAGAAAMIPGQSMHTDWMHGADDTVMMKWQNDCHGVNGATMHICASGRLDADEGLLGGAGGNAPDGSRIPQVDSGDGYSTLVRSDMIQVPASLTGPHVIHAH